ALALAKEASDRERQLVEKLCRSEGSRGTTLATEAMLAKEVRYTTSKPRTSRPIDLNKIPIPSFYFLILEFVRARWPDLKLTSDQEPKPDGYPFMYDRVAVPLPFVYRNGIKFGCSTAKRTKANKFAFISKGSSLIPCQIDYLF
ncbi:hypothetical protein FRC09_016254, partial [Ceratobasidium sp. 395]